ncbi:MAG: hypothetical protein GX601_15945 [Anaerolineales bacterium]|nr:hypothetical protein [Anaerolineales bacterium]
MPTFADLLARVSFLAAMPAVAAIFLTAGVLVASREWRLNVTALAVQYFFVVLLLSRQIRMEVAAVKGLIGWIVCMVFYMTERRVAMLRQAQIAESGSPAPSRPRWAISARGSFSLLSAMLIAVAAYAAALRLPLPQVSPDITLACYVLAGFGILLIGLSESPMQVGFGALTFLSGFDLFYVALEPSLVVAGLLGALSFAIVLVTASLRLADATASSKGSTG